MRKRVLHFLGPLKKLCPEPVTFFSNTVAEAIQAVTGQLDGFKPHPINGRMRLSVAGYDDPTTLFIEDDREDIYITPALAFGKDRGMVQIVIGAVLIAAAVATQQYWAGEVGLKFLAGAAVYTTGIAMVIGGVMQMLWPQPELGSVASEEEERSKYLGAPRNTTRIGTPIPIPYGTNRIGGQILSFDIQAVDTGQ